MTALANLVAFPARRGDLAESTDCLPDRQADPFDRATAVADR